ncbi:MAG TPA: hypothetical protein DCL29_05425 [Eubacterium sp.]|nr:hypothetical protein [Eubacterium sp.]
MRLCRISNGTVINFDNVTAVETNICRLSKEPFEIIMYIGNRYKLLYSTSILDDMWKVYEALVKKLEEDIRLGTKLIDLREVLKDPDFFTMPEGYKEISKDEDLDTILRARDILEAGGEVAGKE